MGDTTIEEQREAIIKKTKEKMRQILATGLSAGLRQALAPLSAYLDPNQRYFLVLGQEQERWRCKRRLRMILSTCPGEGIVPHMMKIGGTYFVLHNEFAAPFEDLVNMIMRIADLNPALTNMLGWTGAPAGGSFFSSQIEDHTLKFSPVVFPEMSVIAARTREAREDLLEDQLEGY